MNSRQFLLEYFEIEPERFEQEGDICIAEQIYDDISNGDIDELLKVMEEYANYKIKEEMIV